MRKIIESKTGKLIISMLISLILFNFIMPTYSHAETDHWAGKLIEPLADLTCSIGDGLMNLMQGTMMPGSPKAVTKRRNWDSIKMEDGKFSIDEQKIEEIGELATGSGFWDRVWDVMRGNVKSVTESWKRSF